MKAICADIGLMINDAELKQRDTKAVFFSFFDPLPSVVDPDPETSVSRRFGYEIMLFPDTKPKLTIVTYNSVP